MPSKRSLLFDRWPRFASRHPWYVLAGGLIVVSGFIALYVITGGSYTTSFEVPGTESQRAVDLLEERFSQTAGDPATALRAVAPLPSSNFQWATRPAVGPAADAAAGAGGEDEAASDATSAAGSARP